MDIPPAARANPVPCIDRSKVPARPATSMPEPGSDPDRMMAGAAADVRKLNSYADKLEALMVGCFEVKGDEH